MQYLYQDLPFWLSVYNKKTEHTTRKNYRWALNGFFEKAVATANIILDICPMYVLTYPCSRVCFAKIGSVMSVLSNVYMNKVEQ